MICTMMLVGDCGGGEGDVGGKSDDIDSANDNCDGGTRIEMF